jgi:hypothetical protein
MTANPACRKRRRELAKGPIVPLAPDDVDDERTVSDQSAGGDAPDGIEVESLVDVIDEVGVGQDDQPEEDLLAEAIKEAVTHLRAIKKLTGPANVRAALPPAHLLGEKTVWTTPRVRTLALRCGFAPPPGVQRNRILEWIEEFRFEREGDDPAVEPLQHAPPAAVDLSAEDADDVALARLRDLEETELLALVEEEKQASALAAVSAAAEQREARRDALAAAHDAKMKALREQISASERARTAPLSLPLLAESKAARMDRGVSRPPAPPLRPARSEPAAPPRGVERPFEAVGGGEPLVVSPYIRTSLFLCGGASFGLGIGFSVIAFMFFPVCFARLLLQHCPCVR